MTTTDKHNKALVPKLRFPEFRDGWCVAHLGDQGEFVSALAGKTRHDFGTGNASFIPYKNVFSNTFIDSDNLGIVQIDPEERQNRVKKGDVFFTVSSETPEEAGMSSVLLEDIQNCYTNSFCAVFRFSDFNRVVLTFLGYLFRQSVTRTYFSRVAQGSTRFNLSKSAFRDLKLFLPAAIEQQKIADCLTSLDERIQATDARIDALKAHKKGLMQQLFPTDGATTPQRRFPEFRHAGEWEFEELGKNTIKVGSGITPRGGSKNYKTAGRPFVRSQNVGWGVLLIDDIVYLDETTHASFSNTELQLDDVLLNISGASIGRSIVAGQTIAGGNVNQHVCIIRTNQERLQPLFLNQFLLSNAGQTQIDSFQAGGNRQGLNFGQIRSFSVPTPPDTDEQQRIADCLSSLDELIAATTAQRDALNQHKKGLMQQLFPALDEDAA